jgi:hypothetical protein
MNEFDIVLRHVPSYGWLALLVRESHEHYRTGSFKESPECALNAAMAMAAQLFKAKA